MRLRGIGPEVLLLCFLIIGAAAFALGRRSARGRRLRRDVDYFAGLDHLVNDRFDRATEVFTRLATKSHEADIQFALGSLMRKRGEVDRAIAIHTELAAHRESADPRAGDVRAGPRLHERGPHGSRRGKAAQPAGVGALSRRPCSNSSPGSTSSSASGARRSTCGASCRPRSSANLPSWPRTTAASSAKRRWRRANSPARARRLRRRACTHPDGARASMLAARIAAAVGRDEQGARAVYRGARRRRAPCWIAFEAEARAALGVARPARSTTRLLRAAAAATTSVPPEPPRVPLRRVRRRQRHLALALPELPQLGFPAKHAIIAAFDRDWRLPLGAPRRC